MIQSEKWNIIYYEKSDRNSPIYEFINNLDAKAKSKIINTIDLLEVYGIRLGLPHVKKVIGTDLWELRVLGGDSIRIFYVAVTDRTFLLLHGFIKKTQKAPRKEIAMLQWQG